jgi:hypothetical protein
MDDVLLAWQKLPRRDKLKALTAGALCIWAIGLSVSGLIDGRQLQQAYLRRLLSVCAHASSDIDSMPAGRYKPATNPMASQQRC